MPERRRRRRRQAGQAILEGGLIAVAFLTCLVGVLELGRYVLFIQFFTERARAGARYAAVSNYDTTTIKNWVVYNTATAPSNGGGGTTPGLFGLTPSMVSVARYSQGADTDRLEISINNYPVTLYIPMMASNWTLRPFRVVLTTESLGATN